jgi:hypothetical protein
MLMEKTQQPVSQLEISDLLALGLIQQNESFVMTSGLHI